MRDRTDPARLLQEAWSVVRLDTIREFVGETIERLRQLSPQQLLGRADANPGSRFDLNPIGLAWQACSDELRAESGVPDPEHLRSARTDSIHRRLAAEPEWAAEYQEALGRYRRAAAQDLDAWLGALPPARSAETATERGAFPAAPKPAV
jgi:hypothetical protein